MPHKRCLRKHYALVCRKARNAAREAAAAGVEPPSWARSATIHVQLASRPHVTLAVPALQVTHVPAPAPKKKGSRGPAESGRDTANQLLLCPSCEDPAATPCPYGSACPYVHADIRGAPEYQPHEKAAAVAGAYQRFPRGLRVRVAGIDAPMVPSEHLLVTRAPVGRPQEVDRIVACDHFTRRGRCERGSECNFAHVVVPDASPSGCRPGVLGPSALQGPPVSLSPPLPAAPPSPDVLLSPTTFKRRFVHDPYNAARVSSRGSAASSDA